MLYFVISEARRSDQLFGILSKICRTGIEYRVVYFGTSHDHLYLQLLKVSPRFIQLVPHSRIGIVLSVFYLTFHFAFKRPKIVFSSGRFASFMAMLLSRFFYIRHRIFIRHHTDLHTKNKKSKAIFIDKLTNRASSEIIAVSTIVKNILIFNEGVDGEKIKTVYHGIDMRRFHRKIRRKHNAYCEHKFRIGSVGRHGEEKGIPLIQKAVVQLQSLGLSICWTHVFGSGTASEFNHIREAAPHRDINFCSEYQNIEDFYRSIDILVHIPIQKTSESFGLVYLEAIAMGLDCYFTKSGVLVDNELLSKFYFKIDHGSFESLAKSLYIHLSGNELRIQPSQLELEQFHSFFSLESMVARYYEILISRLSA
jgi:glycosyltransferase involved in cell wall biosynthesis